MGVAVSILTKLGVARPVPLVFDRPALPHQTEQCFWAGAQGGDEQVHVVKRLAVTGSANGQEQSRQNRHQHGRTSQPVTDFQSALGP